MRRAILQTTILSSAIPQSCNPQSGHPQSGNLQPPNACNTRAVNANGQRRLSAKPLLLSGCGGLLFLAVLLWDRV
eukprot:14885870-Alexandrium_andersonii.AAC.1